MPQHTHAGGTGGVRRGPRLEKNFTVLPNDVINDSRLSFRARGILSWLLAKPDDWRILSDVIARESPGEGREAIRTAMRELSALGYLERVKVQDEHGHWHTIQTVYEVPETDEPHTPAPGPRKPAPGTPPVGRPGAFTKDRTPRTETDNDTAPTRAPLVGVATSSSESSPEEPPAYRELAAACAEAGLTATFDHVKPAQKATIVQLIELHGITTLVQCAKTTHRQSNPTLFAQGWIRAWSTLPVRRPPDTGPPQFCGDCDEGWLGENEAGAVIKCPCRETRQRAA